MRKAILLVFVVFGSACAQFQIGVCTHFAQGKGYLPANLNMILQSGATTIRDEVGWATVEKKKGEYVIPEAWDGYVGRAVYAGLDPLLILDYGNKLYGGDKPISDEAVEGFARYAEFIVGHFKGKVKLYEIWNEWDIAIGSTTPGTAETYVKLLKAVYPRIKKIDPSITVLGGAMTSGGIRKGWLENMVRNGGLQYLDAVSIHSYNHSAPGRGRTPEAWAEFVATAQATVRKYSGNKEIPLYISEMGWPTQAGARGTSPTLAAAYLARMFLLARTMPYLQGIWWYDFQDDGWNPEDKEANFGIVRPDLTPKPAFYAMTDISKIVPLAEFQGRLDAEDPDIWVLKLRGPDGNQALAIWSTHDEDGGWRVNLHTSRPDAEPVSIREIGHEATQREWGTRDWPGRSSAPVKPNELSLVVRETPWLVIGNMEGVTVGEVLPALPRQ